MSGNPIDPRTGRTKLGGRAQIGQARRLACRWIPVSYPTGHATHLVSTTGRTLANLTLRGHNVARAEPAITARPLCETCRRLRGPAS